MQSTPDSIHGRRRGSLTRWLLVLCVLVIGLALGAVTGHYYARKSLKSTSSVNITAEQIAAQDAAVRQSEAESRFLRAQLDTADGEIAVERAARKELETQLLAAQDEIGLVRERLAFFEQLLPPGPEGVVDIRGAEVQREGQGLKYRVLLMRSGRGDAPFTGALRFQASGVLKGEVVSVDLAPMQVRADAPASTEAAGTGTAATATVHSAVSSDAAESSAAERKTADSNAADSTTAAGSATAAPPVAAAGSADDTASKAAAPAAATSSNAVESTPHLLPLRFSQYQRSEGVLELPEGFVPESVTVSLLEGTTVRASRTVKLAF